MVITRSMDKSDALRRAQTGELSDSDTDERRKRSSGGRRSPKKSDNGVDMFGWTCKCVRTQFTVVAGVLAATALAYGIYKSTQSFESIG